MLQRDYILEIIARFVQLVTESLRRALEQGSRESAEEVEQAIAELVDLDPSVAMQLSPDSLVTMMVLSGVGDSVGSHVAFSLNRLADAYERMGDANTAALRREQAEAVGEAFACDPNSAPEGMEELARTTDEGATAR